MNKMRLPWDEGSVHLTRVAKDRIIDYGSYEYYAGLGEGENPLWSSSQSDARPLEGIETMMMASAMYHEGTERFLFLTHRFPTGISNWQVFRRDSGQEWA